METLHGSAQGVVAQASRWWTDLEGKLVVGSKCLAEERIPAKSPKPDTGSVTVMETMLKAESGG